MSESTADLETGDAGKSIAEQESWATMAQLMFSRLANLRLTATMLRVLPCSLRLPPRSGFPFLRGPALYWGTVLDIIFRCGQENRRRGRGRDG